jgi:MGT family glycosyltransferase
VLASLGTVFNTTPGVLEAIVTGVAGQDVNLIVAIGPNQDTARFGSVPSNVRLESYVAQPQLLPHCDLFITHGGFNSVKESLTAGVPMVVVPITADQPYCAQRCAALGVGRVVMPDQRNAETVRSAVEAVLGDAAYATKARAFAAEMHALPGPETVVALLSDLVTNDRNRAPSTVARA